MFVCLCVRARGGAPRGISPSLGARSVCERAAPRSYVLLKDMLAWPPPLCALLLVLAPLCASADDPRVARLEAAALKQAEQLNQQAEQLAHLEALVRELRGGGSPTGSQTLAMPQGGRALTEDGGTAADSNEAFIRLGSTLLTARTSGALAMSTSDATRVVVSASGEVGIGTEAPASRLHVAGTATVDDKLVVDGLPVGAVKIHKATNTETSWSSATAGSCAPDDFKVGQLNLVLTPACNTSEFVVTYQLHWGFSVEDGSGNTPANQAGGARIQPFYEANGVKTYFLTPHPITNHEFWSTNMYTYNRHPTITLTETLSGVGTSEIKLGYEYASYDVGPCQGPYAWQRLIAVEHCLPAA